MNERRFELIEGRHCKFWSILVDDPLVADMNFVVRYGRIGTNGQTQIKIFANYDMAWTAAQRKIEEKLCKGYSEVRLGDAARKPRQDQPRKITIPAPQEVPLTQGQRLISLED